MNERRPYEPPAIVDHTKPTWVRVEQFAAVTSVPRKRRRYPATPALPTWFVLGPLPETPGRARPTIASGTAACDERGLYQLRVLDGQVPEVIHEALLEAVRRQCPKP